MPALTPFLTRGRQLLSGCAGILVSQRLLDWKLRDLRDDFSDPKGLDHGGPGTKTSDTTDGDRNLTQWKTEVPIPLAGYNFGRFKVQDAKLPDQKVTVEAYANLDPSSLQIGFQNWATEMRMRGHKVIGIDSIGTMNTTSM